MHDNKYLMRLVSYFLPKSANILEIGDYYKVFAVLEGDVDGDKTEEVLALYKFKSSNYIILLKSFNKKWKVIYNKKLNYKEITKFELAKLTPPYKQIILGGKLEEEQGYKLILLNWDKNQLKELLDEPVDFDKIYIQDIDGKDGLDEIILWKHKLLEAYDVDLYRYKEGILMPDRSLDKYYFKEIVNYYEYLSQNYDEEIYKEYLENAKRRCEQEYKNVEEQEEYIELKVGKVQIVSPIIIRDEEEEYEEAYQDEVFDETDEILFATEGYIESGEREDDIYLWGKKYIEDERTYITQLKLIITSHNKKKRQMVVIDCEEIYDYKLFLGDFTGRGIEEIWVGVSKSPDNTKKYVCIYTIEKEGIRQIFDTRKWEKSSIGIYGETLELGSICEIYPVDRRLEERYEVCYLQPIQRENEPTKYLVTLAKFQEGEIKPYQYSLLNNTQYL